MAFEGGQPKLSSLRAGVQWSRYRQNYYLYLLLLKGRRHSYYDLVGIEFPEFSDYLHIKLLISHSIIWAIFIVLSSRLLYIEKDR